MDRGLQRPGNRRAASGGGFGRPFFQSHRPETQMNRRTYRQAGVAAGALTAFIRSNPADDLWKRLAEAIGGALGGNIGARIPDWIEPAMHSHHRSTIRFGVKVASTSLISVPRWEAECRTRADYFAARMRQPHIVGLEWLKCLLAQAFWRVSAGCLGGAFAGFGSRLALDSTTTRGLPLLVRGF